MHWTASAGTTYISKGVSMQVTESRLQTIIVCVVLSVMSCMALLGFAFFAGHRTKVQKSRAQQLVLACVYFNEDGRLLVTPDGTLPSQTITSQYVEQRFGEDELSRSHATFTWLFQASRNWAVLRDLIPAMRRSLDSNLAARQYCPGSATPSDAVSEVIEDFSEIFKELFCVAAHQLARKMHMSLERLGVLFEEPMETGTRFRAKHQLRLVNLQQLPSVICNHDIEKWSDVSNHVGRGKHLFLNRRLKPEEANALSALGYRFGSPDLLATMLSRNLQVRQEKMLLYLERMKLYCGQEHLPAPGIHLAAFVCRPNTSKGFDILVPKIKQNQLPTTSLSILELTEYHEGILDQLSEKPVKEILRILVNEPGSMGLDQSFRWQLHSAFARIIDFADNSQSMMQAIFSSKSFQVPCRVICGTKEPATCTLYTIRLMESIHMRAPHQDFVYVPLNFFGVQNQVESRSGRHDAFTRSLQLEFGYLLQSCEDQQQSSPKTSILQKLTKNPRRSRLDHVWYCDDRKSSSSAPSCKAQFSFSRLNRTYQNKRYTSDALDPSLNLSEDKASPEPPANTPVKMMVPHNGPADLDPGPVTELANLSRRINVAERGYVAEIFALFEFKRSTPI